MQSSAAYKDQLWERQPAAEEFLSKSIEVFLEGCSDLSKLSAELMDRTAIRLRDLVDHISFSDNEIEFNLQRAGWASVGDGIFENESGLFPAFIRGTSSELWIRVEDVSNFLKVRHIDSEISGAEFSRCRKAIIYANEKLKIGVIERNGYRDYIVPPVNSEQLRSARFHLQVFRSRRRQFDTVEQGLAHTEQLIDQSVAAIGADWSCDLWLRAEREYWLRNCATGRLQKAKQDAVGIGWANIDHHTYDGSRKHFRHTIRILEKLGYQLREMLYAGELAGWGSQVLWQPAIRSTIFADVDLAPNELTIDFSHEVLPDLTKHRRAGLLSELLGESILEAGLNHVAGLYSQSHFRNQLNQSGIEMMKPFTDWPHLYQELTTGDWAAVDPIRVQGLLAAGHIEIEEAEKLCLQGSIITHFENIERNDGFKGFNRDGIDGVLRKLDPRAYL